MKTAVNRLRGVERDIVQVPQAGDVLFSDASNHASLIDGMRLSPARRVVFPHHDVSALARLLHELVEATDRFAVAGARD